MSGGGNSQKVDHHGLIVSPDLQIDLPGKIGRPMPVNYAGIIAGIKSPVDRFIQRSNNGPDGIFLRSVLIKILPGSEQSLHKKSSFYDVTSIVKIGKGLCLASFAI